MEITNITIEQASKNILVDYRDEIYDSQGNKVGEQNSRKGYNPLIAQDWDAIVLVAELGSYKEIAWIGLERPIDEIQEVDADE